MQIQAAAAAVTAAELKSARVLLQQIYEEEAQFAGSPVTLELVTINLDHVTRVQANAAAIAAGEGLDAGLLELAALLHDICKLDHREVTAGGIDTWHHHYRGSSLATKIVLSNLMLGPQVAHSIGRMVEAHSDIPFIRRYWETVYHSSIPTPSTPEEFALRDADVVDLLWVGGVYKIVHLRQIPNSMFYIEDGGDIRKAVMSARGSFLESVSVLSTAAGRRLAEKRILIVEALFDGLLEVRTLQEFDSVYERFLAENT